MGSAYTLRPARASDRRLLLQLYAHSRTEELAALGWSDAEVEGFLEMQFAAREVHYRAVFAGADDQIIQVQGKDVGRLLVDRHGQAMHLVDVSILPSHRSKGLGTCLLMDLLQQAAQIRRPLLLSVDINSRARALYKRLGLVETKVHGLHVSMHWQPPPTESGHPPVPSSPAFALASPTS